MTTEAPPHPDAMTDEKPTDGPSDADAPITGSGSEGAPKIIRIGDVDAEPPPVPALGENVHPRVRERRAAVARAIDLRRFRVFVVLAAVVLLGCVAWAIAKSPWFSVRTIEVRGNQRVETAEIVQISGLSTGTPMIDVNLGGARTRIAALAWIDTVSVKRSWPRTLTISVTERRAATAVADVNGVLWLVDPTGRALEPAREDTIGALPRVVGPAEVALEPAAEISGPQLNGVKVAASLPVSLRAQLVQVDYDANGSVDLKLASGIIVRLGTPERLVDKYVAVLTVLSGPDASKLATIDVRSPQTPAVTVQQAATTARGNGK